MKVLLKQDVPGLGSEGEIKEVSTGYARNYLIPQQLAVVATAGTLKMVEAQQKVQAAREARMAARASELAHRMAALTLTFEAKAGSTGRLYGSVTTADIAEALEQELKVRIDKRKILGDPLRQLGEHTVAVRLSSEVEAEVRVVVKPEGGEEFLEEAAEPEEMAETPEEAAEPAEEE